METGNEIKGFNIVEALKYAPKGLKLYTPLFGEVDLSEIENGIIRVENEVSAGLFNHDGRYYDYPNAECLLYPSINHRCWNNWQNTLFPKSIGSVCVDTITGNKFILDHNGTFFSDGTGSQYSTLIDDEDSGNYLLNSRYATPEEAKEFFEELEKNGYKWDDSQKTVVKKEVVPHKFKVGDIVKFDRPSATVKREILSIDFENERYLTRRTDIGGAIKEFIYFCEQDDYVIVGSHDRLSNLSIEVKVSVLADEILALKEKLLALEKLAKDSEIKIDALECGGKPFQCPDKAGDNITLEDMRNE